MSLEFQSKTGKESIVNNPGNRELSSRFPGLLLLARALEQGDLAGPEVGFPA